jgi:tripartite-type tricarboxylate transporter receptor subunit TctC
MRLIQALLGAVIATAATSSRAADYPTETVRFIVPYAAAGATDVITRVVAQHMSDTWRVPVIVENRVGASGVVGSRYVTTQKPDGLTLLAVASAFGVRAAIDPNLGYDPSKDFAGVARMAISSSFLVVTPDLGLKSVQDLVRYANQRSGGVFYATAGVGTNAHMNAAMTAHLAGVKATHVPARGTPQAVTEALAGRVLYAFAPGPNVVPLAKAGKLQILMTTSAAGARLVPGTPTMADAGLNFDEGDDWFGVLAPAGTPVAIRQQLSREIQRILALPDVRERLQAIGAEPAWMGADDFERMVGKYVTRINAIAAQIGLTVQ